MMMMMMIILIIIIIVMKDAGVAGAGLAPAPPSAGVPFRISPYCTYLCNLCVYIYIYI